MFIKLSDFSALFEMIKSTFMIAKKTKKNLYDYVKFQFSGRGSARKGRKVKNINRY